MVRASRISSARARRAAEPGNKLAPEIDAQAVAHHRQAKIVDRAGQLPDLIARQELRLVDEDAGDGALCVCVFRAWQRDRCRRQRYRRRRRCRCGCRSGPCPRARRWRRSEGRFPSPVRGSCRTPATARSTCPRSWWSSESRVLPWVGAYRGTDAGARAGFGRKFQSLDNSKNAAGLDTLWPDHATIWANSADRPKPVTKGIVATNRAYPVEKWMFPVAACSRWHGFG